MGVDLKQYNLNFEHNFLGVIRNPWRSVPASGFCLSQYYVKVHKCALRWMPSIIFCAKAPQIRRKDKCHKTKWVTSEQIVAVWISWQKRLAPITLRFLFDVQVPVFLCFPVALYPVDSFIATEVFFANTFIQLVLYPLFLLNICYLFVK